MTSAFQNPQTNKKILIADDEPEIRGYLELALRCHGHSVSAVVDGEEVLRRLQNDQHGFSLVLLDVLMPGQNGLETLRLIRQFDSQLPVIMFSGAASPVTVVEAMKNGATNFLSKPISHEDLVNAIEEAVPTRQPIPAPPIEFGSKNREAGLMPYRPIKNVESVVTKIGSSSIPVLIQGETGVGKEVVARRLHLQSSRAGKPFLKLNCAALPPELVESELFGHERGSFTGAFERKPGLFELASGGTILLDEIGDMDFKLQAKLLQVLQDQEFQRVGGRQVIRVDVRVIAATHCDLEVAITEKRFRADLYYRLNVISIFIPPLRERKEEIIPLAELFIARHTRPSSETQLPADVRRALTNYSWPGNVRELDNVVRRWLVLRDAQQIMAYLEREGNTLAPNRDRGGRNRAVSSSRTVLSRTGLHEVKQASREAEREAIYAALNVARWNRKKASVALGIDYKALLYMMKKLGIESSVPEPVDENTSLYPHRMADSALNRACTGTGD